MIKMFICVLLIILIYSINYFIPRCCKQLRLIQMAKTLPGPRAYPIIGNVSYFLKGNLEDVLRNINLVVSAYPSPMRLWLGNKLLIYLTNPDQIKTILQHPNCLNKSMIYTPIKSWLGTGLITAPAHIWFTHRKMIASSFNTNILQIFCDTFVEQSLIFTEKLSHMLNDEVDLFDHIARCTSDIIHGTSLGTKLESQSNKNNPYVKAVKGNNLFPDIIFNLTSLRREQQKHLNFMHSSAEKVIQEKENVKNNWNMTEDAFTKPPRKVFLDILMDVSDKGKKFTRKDILDEINTVAFAATDTTAITLNFLIFMLANFPEIQEKIYKELMGIYGMQDSKSTPVKFKDLQYMNYLECVINETLRLFPSVPFIGRYLTKDIKIEEHTLPKGADVMISILLLHRNEKYWPNALNFDPDRFLPKNKKSLHPYSYIPFSMSPRNCIGMRYAMISMKVFLATVMRTYIFKVDKSIRIDEIELKMDLTLAPFKPLKVKVEKRNL